MWEPRIAGRVKPTYGGKMRIQKARRTARVSVVGAALALSAALVGCSGDSTDDNSPETGETRTTPGNDESMTSPEGSTSDGESSPQESSSDSGGGDETDVNKVDLANQKFDLTWKDALDKAKDNFDGDVSKIELEVEGKVYAYKIELLSDTEKYEYEIDANTGDVLEQETDDLDKDEVKSERKNHSIDLDKVISVEDAMKTALGEQDGRVKEWKIEGKTAGPRYEFDIEKSGSTDDVEIKVDAISGDIIRTGD